MESHPDSSNRHQVPWKAEGEVATQRDDVSRLPSPPAWRHVNWPSTRITLVERLKQREELDWQLFEHMYSRAIRQFCVRMRVNQQDIDDDVQDVLLRVASSIKTYQPDPGQGQFRNWLGILVKRSAGLHFARMRKVVTSETGPAGSLRALDADIEGEWADACKAVLFESALERIEKEFDRITWMAFYESWVLNRPPRDVARKLRRDAAWVYRVLYRLLRRLREEIESLADDTMLFSQ